MLVKMIGAKIAKKKSTMTNELANLERSGSNPVQVFMASLVSKRSRQAMMIGLRCALSIVQNMGTRYITVDDAVRFPWERLEYQHVQSIQTALLSEGYAATTVNNYMAAVKGVLNQAWKLGLISADQHAKATAIKPVREVKLPSGRYVEPEEVKAAIHAALSDPNRIRGIRDAAVMALMYGVGARREEVASLTTQSFSPHFTEVTIYGKGRKERRVPIPAFTKKYLNGWAAIAHPIDRHEPFFLGVRKNGSLGKAHLSTTAIWDIVKERFAEAGLQEASPHDFRRSMATNYLDNDVDTGTVANLGGWSDHRHVNLYNRHKDKQMKKAADELGIEI